MSFKKLSNPGAFAGGSDLWLLPSPLQSAFTRKVDWYLNFLVARAQEHQPKALAPSLLGILQDNEIELGTAPLQGDQSPLLLSSSHRLPNQYTVILPFMGEPLPWLEQAHQIWQGLGRPSLRLFLPLEIKDRDLEAHWPQENSLSVQEMQTSQGDMGGPGFFSFVPGDLPLEA